MVLRSVTRLVSVGQVSLRMFSETSGVYTKNSVMQAASLNLKRSSGLAEWLIQQHRQNLPICLD